MSICDLRDEVKKKKKTALEYIINMVAKEKKCKKKEVLMKEVE